jgi:hypothetical protein
VTTPRTVLQFPDKRRPKADCQGEIRTVSLRSPVMNQLLRSLGVEPAEWWIGQATGSFNQALKDIEAHASRAHVREMLLQALEEYRT